MSVERYMVDDAGTLIDKVTRDNYDTVEEVVSILNHYNSTLEKFVDENEQLKKALLFYIDVSLCETSSNFNKDFDNICNNLFGCSYNEIKPLYSDIGVEDDVFALFQR